MDNYRIMRTVKLLAFYDFFSTMQAKNLVQKHLILLILIAFMQGCGGGGSSTATEGLTPLEELGSNIFNDTNLSSNGTQPCASCHTASAGFADPDSGSPTSAGAIVGRIGTRNAPTASYASHIPGFSRTGGNTNDQPIGGQFLDGRASTLELQARAPFLNSVEMNMADEAAVIAVIQSATYAADFEAVFPGVLNSTDTATAYTNMTQAIAAFKRTTTFSPFTSKFDTQRGAFTNQENRGFNLFRRAPPDGVRCNRCHSIAANPAIFSNFEYENIGVPANTSLTATVGAFIDFGLGTITGNVSELGQFRVPTLRNVELTAPYMHNGVFNTLREVVDFYNTRLVADAEFTATVTTQDVGGLGLTSNQVDDIVAFLETLTDGFN